MLKDVVRPAAGLPAVDRLLPDGPAPDELRTLLAPVLGGHLEPFLAGGLATMASARDRRWIQVGLGPKEASGEVFREVAGLSSALLADPAVTNFFFMRKPPGIRLRFETSPERRALVESELHRRLARLPELFESVRPGMYEPEELLFGGPASMPFVHRIFTIDSLAWLDFHRLGTSASGWAFSLALLRRLLAGVGVVGWEDLEVWARIGRQTGRTLPSGMTAGTVAAAGAGIRAAWSDPGRLDANLPASVRALVERWGPELHDAGDDWRTGYFDTRAAIIGPREAAAFVTIFHWNRGGISGGTQSLLATALSDRTARP